MNHCVGSRDEREAIGKILRRVLERWRHQLRAEEEELEKTLVLSPRVSDPEKGGGVPKKEVSKEKAVEEEVLPETVIIGPKEEKERISVTYGISKPEDTGLKPSKEEPAQTEEFLEETVILKTHFFDQGLKFDSLYDLESFNRIKIGNEH